MSLIKGCSMIMFGGGACALPLLNLFNSGQQNPIAPPSTTNQVTASLSPEASSSGTSSETNSGRETQTQLEARRETIQVREQENCVFKATPDKVTITEWEAQAPNYISFACSNSGQHENVITSKWTIWIPKVLLKVEKTSSLKDGERINIKTETVFEGDGSEDSLLSSKHITTFTSESFVNSPIIGKWGYYSITGEDYSDYESFIYGVTITNLSSGNDLIYLRLN